MKIFLTKKPIALMLSVCLIFVGTMQLSAAPAPLTFTKGRIAMSNDGNSYDWDDVLAVAMKWGMLASFGVQDKLVHWDLCDNMEKNTPYEQYLAELESGTGWKYFPGFADPATFMFDCQKQMPEAIANFKREAEKSSVDDPLFLICSGPMEVPWRLINAVKVEYRKYITCISHSSWNEDFKAGPNSTHTWAMMKTDFVKDGVQFRDIYGQNNLLGTDVYDFSWLKSMPAGTCISPDAWKWVASRDLKNTKTPQGAWDCSDAGMMWYLLTGNDHGTGAMIKERFLNPICKTSDATDIDNDGIKNTVDNCPSTANSDQKDSDGDGKGDVCDNCPTKANADQLDTDKDGKGDLCDNCPTTANTDQKDTNGNGIGDVCDATTDTDGDGIANAQDNCPTVANPDQKDTDADGIGDACEGVTYIANSTITYYAPGKNEISYNAAKNVEIGKSLSTITIDGKDDESAWKNAKLFEGQTIGKGSAEELAMSKDDAQLSWKAAWDATALYVVIKAKDDVMVWNDALKGWNIDALEFYVTTDAIVNAETGTNLARATQAKVLWQNMYLNSPDGKAIMEFRGADNTSLSGTKTPVAGTSVARTYDDASKTTTFEIKYEWASILTGTNAITSVAENLKIRIGMMFNDNDNATADARDHKVYYVEKAEPNSASAFKDFAVVTLKNVVNVGIKNQNSIDNLLMYPNPASGMVMFSKMIDADFYNLAGQKVLSIKNSSKADISTLPKGMYQVKASNGLNYKLVVNY